MLVQILFPNVAAIDFLLVYFAIGFFFLDNSVVQYLDTMLMQ